MIKIESEKWLESHINSANISCGTTRGFFVANEKTIYIYKACADISGKTQRKKIYGPSETLELIHDHYFKRKKFIKKTKIISKYHRMIGQLFQRDELSFHPISWFMCKWNKKKKTWSMADTAAVVFMIHQMPGFRPKTLWFINDFPPMLVYDLSKNSNRRFSLISQLRI